MNKKGNKNVIIAIVGVMVAGVVWFVKKNWEVISAKFKK